MIGINEKIMYFMCKYKFWFLKNSKISGMTALYSCVISDSVHVLNSVRPYNIFIASILEPSVL